MSIFIGLMTIALLLFIVSAFISFVFGSIVEPAYILAYNKPMYVHFYMFPKDVNDQGKTVLEKQFRFYRNLSEIRKKYFRHRVRAFIENYQFVGREGLEVTEEMKIKIAATDVMLTFGMRNYLPDLFEVIIIYPDIFESRNGEYHKGEFNPAARAVVFSWKDFQEGIEFDSNNLNLGLHEFAHVLHISSVGRRRLGSSSAIYSDMFAKIAQYVAVPANRDKITHSAYFRDYAYTNQYEFMAVVFESFFETPSEFRQRLPELFTMVSRMINYKER